jgi:hypothetical protein
MAGTRSGRVNVAVVLTGIAPPENLGRMAVVVRHIADLLGGQVVNGFISTKTRCPPAKLPERAEAARAALASRSRIRRVRRTVRINPAERADLDLFAQWAPWSTDARLGARGRRDVRLSLASSGRSFWVNIEPESVDELDGWLRSRALGHLVDIDKWAVDQKQKQKQTQKRKHKQAR